MNRKSEGDFRTVFCDGGEICYFLTYKKVKNINVRVKGDGSVHASAPKHISAERVDGFILSRANFILSALGRMAKRDATPSQRRWGDDEIKEKILSVCHRVYPYFEARGVGFPTVKFRSMKSMWGSCRAASGVLTFNTRLAFADESLIEYVVLHEFCHFLEPNHSESFYRELSRVCPDYKERRKALKNININE